jgi:hypothetical protein
MAAQMIKFVWPLFNTVQLLLVTVKLAVYYPATLTFVLKQLEGIIELDSLPREEIKEYLVSSSVVKFLMELDPIMLLVIVVIPFMLLILIAVLITACCLKKNGHKCPKCNNIGDKITKSLKDKLMFSMPLRTLIVSYLGICITA